MELSPVRYARTSDGAEVAWAEIGSGPALVLGGTYFGPDASDIELARRVRVIREFVHGLAEFSRVLILDHRGTGYSPPPLPASSGDLISDVLAVVDAAGLDSFALAGMAYYAPFTLETAVRHPDRVSTVILAGPLLSYAEFAPGSVTEPMMEVAKRDWELFARTITGWFVLPEEEREELVAVIRETGSWELRSALHTIEQAGEPPEGLESLRIPVLVMQSVVDDYIVPLALVRRAAAQIPDSRVVTLDGTYFDYTNRVEPIRAFLDEVLPDDVTPPSEALPEAPADLRLSPRELEVLGHIAEGRTNAQIAEAMVITPNTVASHVKHILEKLEAGNRTEAVQIGRRAGLLD